jgi:hypothetical protein
MSEAMGRLHYTESLKTYLVHEEIENLFRSNVCRIYKGGKNNNKKKQENGFAC